MKTLKVNKGKAIPLSLRLVSAVILAFLIIQSMKMLNEPWAIILSIIFSMIMPATWFATKLFEIDLNSKKIFDGIWVMGHKIGKKKSFECIDEIFIDKVKTKQTMYSISDKQSVITNHEFRAYLKINTGEQFYLFSHPLEDKVREKVLEAELKLGIQVF